MANIKRKSQSANRKTTKVLKFKNIPSKKDSIVTKSTKKTPKEKKEVIIPVKQEKIAISLQKTEKVWDANTPIETQKESVKQSESATHEIVQNEVSSPVKTTEYKQHHSRKQKPASKFPNIFRIITDRWFLLGLVSGILLIAILFLANAVQVHSAQKEALLQRRAAIAQQITLWQQKAAKYPNARDAWFQLALLEYQLGNFQESQNYLNKVELLDPNFEDAYKLEKLLR